MTRRIIIDLDETLTLANDELDYSDLLPNLSVVEKLNYYKSIGFEISIHTARNMQTYKNSIGKISAHTLPKIIEWLDLHRIPYDEIYVGKPWCGDSGFYVDDKAIRPDEFINLTYIEIKDLLKIK